MVRKTKGALITFEGTEGTGKSTQVSLAVDYLKDSGRKVLLTREPGGTAFGKKMRKILLHGKDSISHETEVLLYMASRRELIRNVVVPALQSGQVVICDRWMEATVAYQGFGLGVDLKWIQAVAKRVLSGVRPDRTIWFDLPVQTGLERAKKRGELDKIEQRSLKFHKLVRKGYAYQCGLNSRMIRIRPTSIEATHRRVRRILDEVI